MGSEENVIKLGIIKYAKYLRLWPIRIQSGRVKGGRMHCAEKGTSDLSIPIPGGATLYIETKRPGEGLNDNQVKFKAYCDRYEIPYYKADTLEGAKQFIDDYLLKATAKQVGYEEYSRDV